METSRRYQPRLVGLALGVFLALLIWPQTRTFVRSQLALSIPTPATVAPWSFGGTENTAAAREYAQRRSAETALSHPNDFGMQLAAALTVPPADGNLSADRKVLRLRALTERFPDRATLYAVILRFSTVRQVRIERDEERRLTGDPAPNAQVSGQEPYNTPEQLAAFDRDAEIGERLAPDNAYFPFLRSVGLFAAHRDTEALATLRRAATKPAWAEYLNDEVEGEWKLQEETFGTVGAVPRLALPAGVLLPHYRALRSASRVAIAKAVEAEQAGHVEDGLAIRESVRQCGNLLRVQGTTLIGALVGSSFSQISLMRPGGAPPDSPDTEGEASNRRREQRLRAYNSYLEQIGHAEKIAIVDAEVAAAEKARGIVKTAVRLSPYNALAPLIVSWVAGMVLLSSALWMLVLGCGSMLAARHRLIRTGQGLPSALRPGAALGLLAAIPAFGITGCAKGSTGSYLCQLGVAASILVALLLPAAQESSRLRRMGAFVLSFGVAVLFYAAFAWQRDGSIGLIAQVFSLFSSGEGAAGRPTDTPFYVLSLGIASAIPLVTLLTLCILSLLWRVPASVGVVRGLRGCAIPIACALVLAYAVLVPVTLRQENTLNEGMKQSVENEVRFIANSSGNPWPGTTK